MWDTTKEVQDSTADYRFYCVLGSVKYICIRLYRRGPYSNPSSNLRPA